MAPAIFKSAFVNCGRACVATKRLYVHEKIYDAMCEALDFDRDNVRHITFGAGPHRCIGSHLARVEIRIALEEWLARVPEFRTPEGKPPVVRANGVWGVSSLPLAWS